MFYHLMNLPLGHQSMNFLSQTVINVSNNFLSLVDFLRVNWIDMLFLSLLWFSQALKYFNYVILITIKVITFNSPYDFCNSETLFDFAFDFQIFFESTFEGVFSRHRDHCKFRKILPFTQNYMRAKWMFLVNSRDLIYVNKILLSGLSK